MTNDLRTYTGRLARITEILEPCLHVSEYVLATPENNPLDRPNGLACRWFDRRTAQPTVSVFIDELEDVDRSLASLRDDVAGNGDIEPGSVTEVAGSGHGEYVFLRHYVNAVTAIVGSCRIAVHPPDGYDDLARLVEPALEIGRTVGCSAYRNDFVPPPLPEEWPKANWGIGSRSPGFPPGVPPGPPL
ncbi:MAG: hypothetical protein QOJ20_477 [Mycobacterium sp.]|jgi:hypothetical protein|nr:hypothetical protein [Mycobacterium sp.]MDT5279282.1 hypothetical protein [Mycobacterium sp.]